MKIIQFAFVILLLFISSTASSQTISDNVKDDIVGIWVPDEDGIDYRWEFSNSGICKKYSVGAVRKTFSYTVTKVPSLDGTLTFNELELINVNNPEDVYTYNANIVDNNRLYLMYDLRPGQSIDFSRL